MTDTFDQAISARVATSIAKTKALQLGFELTNEIARKILDRIAAKDYVWVGKDFIDSNDTAVFYMNHTNKRLRVVVSADLDRIITLTEREWIAPTGLRAAQSIPDFSINLALGTLLMTKIRDGEIVDTEPSLKEGTKVAIVEVGDQTLRVVYDEITAIIIRVGLKLNEAPRAPVVRSSHPKASHHASQRAVERFDVVLDTKTTELIIHKLRTNQVEDRYPLGGGKGGAVLEIAPGKRAVVIFDQSEYTLVTVTPLEAYERHMDKKTKRDDRRRELKRAGAKEKRHMARSEDR